MCIHSRSSFRFDSSLELASSKTRLVCKSQLIMSGVSSEFTDTEHKAFVHTNANSDLVTNEPEATPPMRASIGGQSTATYEDTTSGYHRETNECTEFCMDLWICFGACDAFCPQSGEGCMSGWAAFCGNLCFSCCKC